MADDRTPSRPGDEGDERFDALERERLADLERDRIAAEQTTLITPVEAVPAVVVESTLTPDHTVRSGPVRTTDRPGMPVSEVTGDPLTTDLDDPTLLVSRRGAVLPASAVRRERNTLIAAGVALAVVAAAIIAFLLLRDDDSESTVVASDTTVVTETVAAETIAADTVATDDPAADTTPATTIVAVTVPNETVTSRPVSGVAATAAPAQTTAGAVKPTASPIASPADVLATAERSSTFGPYLAMVDAAGLRDELRGSRNVTILVPTESAFARLPPELQVALRSPSNRDVLARLVRYGMLTQTRTAAQLTPGSYPTAEGTPVNVQSVNGVVRLNDASITGPDVRVLNGVLHAVDRLLVPPTLDLSSLVPRSTPTPSPSAAPVTTAAAAPQTSVIPPTASPSTAVVPSSVAVTTPTVVPTSVPASTGAPSTSPPTTGAPTTTGTPTTTAAPTTTGMPTTRPPSTTIA